MQLNDVREDDLFLYTDGDELPRPEILQFFKLYDGWPQPVAFQYKWSIYGFFWQVDGKVYGAYSRPIPSMVSRNHINYFKVINTRNTRAWYTLFDSKVKNGFFTLFI